MNANIVLDDSGNEVLKVGPLSYTLQHGMWHVVGKLTHVQKMYAGGRGRDAFRGFAALHDLCDANMLLPCTNLEIENMDDVFPYWQRVQDLATGFLICYHDLHEDDEEE